MSRQPMKRRTDKRRTLPVRHPRPRLVHPVPRKMPQQYRAR